MAAIALCGALFGCALPPPTRAVAIPPPPPGEARIWVYSGWDPYAPETESYILMNGARVGVFYPGYTFYRDVAPGPYVVGVESEEPPHQQFAPVGVVAGQQVYLKVESWHDCGGGDVGGGWCRTNFATYLQLPQVGSAAVAALPFSGW